MNNLIGLVNELQDVFANVKMNVKLNLPQIAVVGSQSSGKSSVLESIVGKDFLPRGSGIVTRCPLVLQLVQLPKDNEKEWGEFLHYPEKKYFDFSEINKEIQSRTVEIAGASGITDRPINLKVFSRNVLDLTLVDLPGLVMNAVGDQPKDIDRMIKEMVTRYVSPVNTIILAVSPANTDLATSASIRLAKQLDPEGSRTIGVLTKLDLMDRGTHALEILSGRLMEMRHGFVGVVNRSQQDINDSKGMEAARQDERMFFQNHPAYSAIADTQGTEYLSKKLNQLLLEHIRAVIPEIKQRVEKLLQSTRKEMVKLGISEQDNVSSNDNLLHLIKAFCDSLKEAIDGDATVAKKDLSGGARLDYIFHECFAAYVYGLEASKDLTDVFISTNIRAMAGMNASLFPSDKVFFALSKQQIERLEEPSVKCITFIYEELLKIIELSASTVERFPKLKQAIVKICHASLESYLAQTTRHIRTMIAAERAFINVKHPSMEEFVQRSFMNIVGNHEENKSSEKEQNSTENNVKGKDHKSKSSGGTSSSNGDHKARKSNMGHVPSNIEVSGSMSQHDKHINNVIREMVESYFSIVKGTVADQVPKAIVLLMVTKLTDEAYSKLVANLYTTDSASNLLQESPEVAARRKATITMLAALVKAQATLDRAFDHT